MRKKKQNQPQETPAKVIQKQGRVLVVFDECVPKEAVKAQVASCEAGTCSCCTPEFRKQVDGFTVRDRGKSVEVEISGTISAEHVKENLIACAPKLKKEK